MRILPLLPSSADPATWGVPGEAELRWDGALHPGWGAFARAGGAVHALHLREHPYGRLADEALGALRLGLALRPDFLVVEAPRPEGRKGGFAFLGSVETLLEALHPKGLKLALKPGPGAEAELSALLKQSRGEAVGYCWHPGVADLEAIADRLFCAVGGAGADLAPLQRLGYRWNLAVEAPDAAAFASLKGQLEARYPGVLFPAEMPTHVMGRPVVPDPEVSFGRLGRES